MKYKMYKFKFLTAVHFGNGSLEDVDYTFCADTLFSALCQEAAKMGKEQLQKFYQYAKDGIISFSDAFPYRGETCYLPKPIKRISKVNKAVDATEKKAYKKLKYIPCQLFEVYLRGDFDVRSKDIECKFGEFYMKTSASIRGEKETKPYRIGQFFFDQECGLYILVGYQDEEVLGYVEELLESLSYSGIGGKRTTGLGKFELHTAKIPTELLNRLGKKGNSYMTLSVSLPKEEELLEAMEDAEYLLIKRSGFVSSDTFADEHMRKKDLYVLKCGSCFTYMYTGDIYDVSAHRGSYPIYRYAKPMFMEVSL